MKKLFGALVKLFSLLWQESAIRNNQHLKILSIDTVLFLLQLCARKVIQ